MHSAAPVASDAPTAKMSRRRRLIVALVLLTVAVSGVVRFAALDTYPAYVFDEYYYVHDASALLRGELGPRGAETWRPGVARSLAHPELATLAIAGSIALFGDGPFGWRLPAALAGTLLIALVYPLARRLRLPPAWALAATVLTAADTMLVVESRLGVLDMFVSLFTAACIYCALRATARESGAAQRRAVAGDGGSADPSSTASGGVALHTSPAFFRWTVLCGLSGGAALASKWSGALALLAALVLYALCARRLGARRLAAAVVGILALTAVVYLLAYSGYFASGHSVADWLHLQRYMLGFDWGVRGTVSFASRPATWPFDVHPIWYKWAVGATGTQGLIAIGNPFLWWAAAVAFIVLGVQAVVRRDSRLGMAPLLVAILYLPWLLTSRQAYIYYMVPVVPFLAILVATGLSRLAPRPAACAPQAMSFAGGGLLTAGACGLAGLGEGVFGTSHAALWRGAAIAGGAVLVAATLIACLRSRRRRAALLAGLSWAYVGATAALGLAWLPFLLGYPVLFEVYQRLTWLVTWK